MCFTHGVSKGVKDDPQLRTTKRCTKKHDQKKKKKKAHTSERGGWAEKHQHKNRGGEKHDARKKGGDGALKRMANRRSGIKEANYYKKTIQGKKGKRRGYQFDLWKEPCGKT